MTDWQNVTVSDLKEIILGGGRVTPYQSRRSVSLSKLGFSNFDLFSNYFDGYAANPGQFLSDYWSTYTKYCDSRILVMYDQMFEALHVHPYLYRGHSTYRKRMRGKLSNIVDNWKFNSGVALRLSLKVTNDSSPVDSYLKLRGCVNKLMSWLSYIKRDNKRRHRIPYIWSIEPTSRGHAHLHILFDTPRPWLVSKRRIDRWWMKQNLGQSPGVWIEKIRGGGRKVVSYVTKYITKVHKSSEWMGLLTLTRGRAIGASRGLLAQAARPVRLIQKKYDMIFLGSCRRDLFPLVMDSAYKKYISGDVCIHTDHPPPEGSGLWIWDVIYEAERYLNSFC